ARRGRGQQQRDPVPVLGRGAGPAPAPVCVVIALVTDSNSQIPASLIERYGITVVPLPVTIDGVDYLEGVDIDADDFYRRFETGTTPTVATAQPSPGQFAAVYDRLVAEGAEA